jgi:hypothetical protein
MQLLLSLMAIGAFCVVAAIIETMIGTTSSTQRLKPDKRAHKSLRQSPDSSKY